MLAELTLNVTPGLVWGVIITVFLVRNTIKQRTRTNANEKIVRVGDLEENTCFLKEDRLWVKQTGGYCLGLDNLVRYQVRPKERVDQVFPEKYRGPSIPSQWT